MKNLNLMRLIATSNKITESTFFKGLMNLLSDLTTALLVLIGVAAVLIFLYFLFRGMGAEEAEEKSKYKKLCKSTIIYGVIAFAADGFLTLVFSYFAS